MVLTSNLLINSGPLFIIAWQYWTVLRWNPTSPGTTMMSSDKLYRIWIIAPVWQSSLTPTNSSKMSYSVRLAYFVNSTLIYWSWDETAFPNQFSLMKNVIFDFIITRICFARSNLIHIIALKLTLLCCPDIFDTVFSWTPIYTVSIKLYTHHADCPLIINNLFWNQYASLLFEQWFQYSTSITK